MKTLYAVVALVALLASGWLGYKLGAGDLEKVKTAGKLAEGERERAAKELDARLAGVKTEYEEKMRGLEKSQQEQKAELTRQLARAQERSAAMEKQREAVSAELRRVRGDLAKTPAADAARAQLEAKERELAAKEGNLNAGVDGLACLAKLVPSEEVRTLNVAAGR